METLELWPKYISCLSNQTRRLEIQSICPRILQVENGHVTNKTFAFELPFLNRGRYCLASSEIMDSIESQLHELTEILVSGYDFDCH